MQWFEDKESGKTLKRPAFDQLQTAIFEGSIKTVVVWKLDRLSRRLKDGINTLANWCERDVRVVSVTQQIDLNGAIGSMLASVMFGLVENQRTPPEADGVWKIDLLPNLKIRLAVCPPRRSAARNLPVLDPY